MFIRAFVGTLLLASLALSAPPAPTPKPGSFYPYGAVGVKKVEAKGSKLNITFRTRGERFHWCPGVKVRNTDKATVLTFVRCPTSQSCGVDIKAPIGKKLIRKITVDTKNKDTYVRVGPKKFKRIYESPESKGKTKATSKKATSKSSAARLPMSNQFVQPAQ